MSTQKSWVHTSADRPQMGTRLLEVLFWALPPSDSVIVLFGLLFLLLLLRRIPLQVSLFNEAYQLLHACRFYCRLEPLHKLRLELVCLGSLARSCRPAPSGTVILVRCKPIHVILLVAPIVYKDAKRGGRQRTAVAGDRFFGQVKRQWLQQGRPRLIQAGPSVTIPSTILICIERRIWRLLILR